MKKALRLKISFVDFGSKKYKEALKLRQAVLREPLGLEYTQQQLAAEQNELFTVAYFEDKLVGCLQLKPLNAHELKVRQVAVSLNYRGKGIGVALMKFAEQYAKDCTYTKLVLAARQDAFAFYAKLGYQQIGDNFIDVTLTHCMMEKSI
jgi:predicted GNAT family N-acyltransferase